MKDCCNREIDYIRLSLTDRCNFRCTYCVGSGEASGPWREEDYLTREELLLLCRQGVRLGIKNFKLTGGEPLLREDLVELVRDIKNISGVETVTLTTNGFLLKNFVVPLKEAGLDGVNISIDTLDRETYARITGVDGLPKVLEGLQLCKDMLPTKLNVVLQRGVNDTHWRELVRFGQKLQVAVRFIEQMPIGQLSTQQTVTNESVLQELQQEFPELKRLSFHGNGPAVYYGCSEKEPMVGFISAVHERFCHRCNRIRVTARGQVKGCLCYKGKGELLPLLRGTGENPEEAVYQCLREAILSKPRMHHFEALEEITEQHQMKEIGG